MGGGEWRKVRGQNTTFTVLTGWDVDALDVLAELVERGAVDGEVGRRHHGDLVGYLPVDEGALVNLNDGITIIFPFPRFVRFDPTS